MPTTELKVAAASALIALTDESAASGVMPPNA